MFYLFFLFFLLILLSIMFITLMERKFLSILNNRKGPNYFLMNSLMQSMMDFIKLITKKTLKLNFIFKTFWVSMIFFGILMFMMLTMIFPVNNVSMYMYINFFNFFLIYSMMSFFFLILSYSSNSVFSIMALYRVLIQIISYEVGMIFMIIFPLMLINQMNFYFYNLNKNLIWMFSIIYMMILLMISLSEMNRTPFDFLESETELVSGFNIEYFSSLFSFIFMVEYGFFLFMMIFLNFFFLLNLIMSLIFMLTIIWIRSFMPRYRYDKMLMMFWKDLIYIVMMFFLMLNIL